MGSIGQWMKWGFVAGAFWAILANPVGCLIWLGILTVVLLVAAIFVGYALFQTPILIPFIVLGIVGVWLMVANWPRRARADTEIEED